MKYAHYLRGLDFVLTLNAENGTRDPTRQSDYRKNGIRERSFGFCQIMDKYHAPFIWKTGWVEIKPGLYSVDPKKAHEGGFTDKFLNYKTQLEYCATIRDDAINKKRLKTTFYGYNVRHKSNNGFYLY